MLILPQRPEMLSLATRLAGTILRLGLLIHCLRLALH